MDERSKWVLDQLTEKFDDLKDEVEILKEFKTKTVEQLKTIFESIKEIKEGNKSMSTLLISLIGSAVLGTISSVIISIINK